MNKPIVWLIFTICFGWLCYTLEAAIAPFFIAFLMAYLIHPLVQKLENKFHHKSLIIALIIATLMCGCLALMILIIPIVYEQTTLLVSKIPAYKTHLQSLITEELSHLNPAIASRLSDALHASFDKVIMVIANSANGILGYFLATISTVVMIFIIPVILFYLLRDFSSCRKTVEQNLPKPLKNNFIETTSEINALLSAYIRGQLKVCLVMATYYFVGLKVIGLDLALLLGMISGLLIILPFVGFLISLTIALIFGYIAFGFSYSMLAILGLYLFGTLLEGTFLTPNIIGDKIGLHPLWIIFAVLAGGALFGFVGMLLAIPLAGICKILLRRCLA